MLRTLPPMALGETHGLDGFLAARLVRQLLNKHYRILNQVLRKLPVRPRILIPVWP